MIFLRGCSNISISIVLTLIEYLLFAALISLGAYYLYKELISKEERQVYRAKLLKQINQKKNVVLRKNKESPFQQRLKATGYESFSALRYQMVRWFFVLVIVVYYVIIPMSQTNQFDRSLLAIPFLLIVLTEPRFDFSLINKGIKFLINRKQRQKQVELFTLFDMLKAELTSLKDNQEINIYSILKESLPMFEHIGGTISRFLSLWKSSPGVAKDVFFQEVGGESAKVLGDILFKLDNTSKGEALKIIESESSVFSFSYYENELQGSIKRKNFFFLMFTINILLIVIWLVVVVFTMFSETMNGTLL